MKLGLAVIVGKEYKLIDNFINKNNIESIFGEIKFVCSFKDKTYDYLISLGFETFYRDLNFDFSTQRNYIANLIESEYICRLDVDELLNDELQEYIKNFEGGEGLYKICRDNLVDGDLKSSEYMFFIYKNNKKIYWKNKLHECLFGFKNSILLPHNLRIIHAKTTNRCAIQNKWYYDNFKEQRRIVDEYR